MKQERIDRINTLYHKSQAVGLTEEEKKAAVKDFALTKGLLDRKSVV